METNSGTQNKTVKVSFVRGVGKLGRSKVGPGKLGLGKLGFGKVGRLGGKLGGGTTSKCA